MASGIQTMGAINIDTKVVRDTAKKIALRQKTINQEFKAIQKEIKYVDGVWESKAEMTAALSVADLGKKVEAFNHDLGEFVRSLAGSAEAYEEVEKAINANAEAFD